MARIIRIKARGKVFKKDVAGKVGTIRVKGRGFPTKKRRVFGTEIAKRKRNKKTGRFI